MNNSNTSKTPASSPFLRCPASSFFLLNCTSHDFAWLHPYSSNTTFNSVRKSIPHSHRLLNTTTIYTKLIQGNQYEPTHLLTWVLLLHCHCHRFHETAKIFWAPVSLFFSSTTIQVMLHNCSERSTTSTYSPSVHSLLLKPAFDSSRSITLGKWNYCTLHAADI